MGAHRRLLTSKSGPEGRGRGAPPKYTENRPNTLRTLCAISTEHRYYVFTLNICVFFVFVSVDFRCILGGYPPPGPLLTSKVAGGRPRRLRDDFSTIFDGFGSPFGVPGWALWGSFWRMFFETDLFKVMFSDLWGLPQKRPISIKNRHKIVSEPP